MLTQRHRNVGTFIFFNTGHPKSQDNILLAGEEGRRNARLATARAAREHLSQRVNGKLAHKSLNGGFAVGTGFYGRPRLL
jgi:hypothetical protein